VELFFSILANYEGRVALVETLEFDPIANLFLSLFAAHS